MVLSKAIPDEPPRAVAGSDDTMRDLATDVLLLLERLRKFGEINRWLKTSSRLFESAPASWRDIVRREDPALAQRLESADLGSIVLTPLRVGPSRLGWLAVGTAESRGRFKTTELGLVAEIAQRASLTLEIARLYRGQRRSLLTLEASLLPSRIPDIDGLDVAARYVPAGEDLVGGDFYDILALDETSTAVVIGDVCGKDATAAALTGLARHTIRAVATRDPADVIAAVNDAILRDGGDRFCTVCFVRLQRIGDVVQASLCRGGHPAPIVVRTGGVVEMLGVAHPAPGILAGAAYKSDLTFLNPGDTLVLFTDGVTEAGTDDLAVGEERLRALVGALASASAEEVADSILRDCFDHRAANTRRRDDVAVMVVRVLPLSISATQEPAIEGSDSAFLSG